MENKIIIVVEGRQSGKMLQLEAFCKENDIEIVPEQPKCNYGQLKPVALRLIPIEPMKDLQPFDEPKNFINGKRLNRKKRKK